jgi:hypothetical protein
MRVHGHRRRSRERRRRDYPLFYGANRPAWFELKGPDPKKKR